MSLRLKLTSILATIVIAFATLDWAVLRGVVYPSFVDLEQDQARQDLNRVFEALQNEVEHLDGLVHDWASWDDTYQFVVDQNAAYVQGNLTQTTLENNELCLISFVRTDGSVAWQVFRPEDGALPEFPGDRRPAVDPLASAMSGEEPVNGFLSTSQGILFFASRPILKSSQEGPSRGRLLMARLLDGERLGELVQQVRVPFQLGPLDAQDEGEGGELAATQLLGQGDDCGFHARSPAELDAFGWLRDFRGQPMALVQAEIPRDVTARGREALDYALATTLLAALLVLGALFFLLQRTVVAPLQQLSAHAESIGRDGDLEARLALERRDEIGILSREFDGMVAELAKSRARLIDTAHQAGMSEVAAHVLHDVGNALNSVNVSAETIARRLSASRVRDLARITEDLSIHRQDLAHFLAEDPRGRQYLSYLAALGAALPEECGELLAECQDLSAGLGHIRELIAAHQELATRTLVLEEVAIAEQVELALRIARCEDDGVRVVRELEDVPRLTVARHKLIQILLNLLKNARESVLETGKTDPCVRVSIALAPGADAVEICVADNGVGIAPEQQVRIFTHGFTTKPGGHGFGLHGAANAARELGGALSVASEGSGRGATFRLVLPLRRGRMAA